MKGLLPIPIGLHHFALSKTKWFQSNNVCRCLAITCANIQNICAIWESQKTQSSTASCRRSPPPPGRCGVIDEGAWPTAENPHQRQPSESAAAERQLIRGRAQETAHTAEGEGVMGNAQDKPPGSGAAGAGGRSNQAKNNAESRSDGSPEETAVVNGRRSSSGASSPAVDESYLDAPAGALPPHLARLKNEGNHLFKHGQFADALGKYTQAIDGCAEAGEALKRVSHIQQQKSPTSDKTGQKKNVDSSSHCTSIALFFKINKLK